MARFQNGRENNNNLSLTSKLTFVIVHDIPAEEAPKVFTIPEIPENIVESHNGVLCSCLCYTTVKKRRTKI